MNGKTIGDLSAELKAQLERLRIAPEGAEIATVSVLSGSKAATARKKRASASVNKSFGADDSIFITFKRAKKAPAADQHRADLIAAMAEAERVPGHAFVALKWLRDTFLPERCPWAEDAAERDRVLRRAIEEDLLQVRRVANPKHPQFPTSSLHLNWANAAVQRLVGPRTRGWDFTPIKIEGEPASVTLRRMRDGEW